jgi:hypothetical protein
MRERRHRFCLSCLVAIGRAAQCGGPHVTEVIGGGGGWLGRGRPLGAGPGHQPAEATPIRRKARIRSVTLADTQRQRLLERLRQAGEQPVAFAELRAGGIDFPAAVVSELELNGYAIERVYDDGRMVGVRLLKPEPPKTPAAHRRRRRPWPHR